MKYSFLAEESAILVYAALLGLELGLVYDLFRIIRRVWTCHTAVLAVMDMMFWGFAAYRTFFIMHTYSNGELRWFAILGTVVVCYIYQHLVSHFVVWIGFHVGFCLKKGIGKGKKALTGILQMIMMKKRVSKSKEKKG